MSISFEQKNECLTISVDGRFDYSCYRDFKNSYLTQKIDVQKYVVDFDNTTFIDSSALGMLLLLKDFVGDEKSIILLNAKNKVKEALDVAMFGQIFHME